MTLGTIAVRHDLSSLKHIKPGLFWENWDECYPYSYTMLFTSNVSILYRGHSFHKMYWFVKYLDQ